MLYLKQTKNTRGVIPCNFSTFLCVCVRFPCYAVY